MAADSEILLKVTKNDKTPNFVSDGFEVASTGRLMSFGNGSMVIHSASKLHDEGYYTCTASNEREESHTGTIQIKVLSKSGSIRP